MSNRLNFDNSVTEEEQMEPAEAVALTVKEVQSLLDATDDSLQTICRRIEEASTRKDVKVALRHFNRMMKVFMGMVADDTWDHLIRQAVCDMGTSQKFQAALTSAASFREAVTDYKTTVVRDLGAALQRAREQADMDEELDDDLLSHFLPGSSKSQDQNDKKSTLRLGTKRVFSAVEQSADFTRIPKKRCTIPALTSIKQLTGSSESGHTEKKNILITREKLRKGLHDPKGLLDLVGSTTNALERTKRMELLKTSGMTNKSQGTRKSFSVKLNEATDRLELGLGGLSVNDTLTFGAKVLSLPGYLTAKNISEVENNVVEGKTT